MLYIIVLALIASILAALFITHRAAVISVLIGIFIATGITLTITQQPEPETNGIHAPVTANAPPSYETIIEETSEALMAEDMPVPAANVPEEASKPAEAMPLTEDEKRAIEASLKPEIEGKQHDMEPEIAETPEIKPTRKLANDTLLTNLKAEKPRKPSTVSPSVKPKAATATTRPVQAESVKAATPKKRKVLLVNEGATEAELDNLATYTEQRGTVSVKGRDALPATDSPSREQDPAPASQRASAEKSGIVKPSGKRRVLLVDGDVTERDELEAIAKISPAAGSAQPKAENFLEQRQPVDLNAVENPSKFVTD